MSAKDGTPSINAASGTEAELEAFRQKWREEVSARNKRPAGGGEASRQGVNTSNDSESRPAAAPTIPGPSVTRRNERFHEDTAPKAYHDLPDKEDQFRIGAEERELSKAVYKEPSSALEYYERAVEKETQGNLSESIRHYRKAFKLDDGVHEAYKRKHFPPSAFRKAKAPNPNPSNAAPTVPRTDHHSLQGSAAEALPATLKQLVDEFESLRIEPPPPPTDASPPEKCPIAELPEEILTHILQDLAIEDVASFGRTAQVCKRLAYLVLTEESIWKAVAMDSLSGFQQMHYDFVVDISGFPLEANDNIANYIDPYNVAHSSEPLIPPLIPEERALAFSNLTELLLQTHYHTSWRAMFRSRPRIRFNGCYISTVNYNRAGANSTNTLTWGAPVHVVTYFRYLRFLRDGTCISLLTTAEPADVVHHLTTSNIHDHHGLLPSSVMRDALRGRWRLSGPASSHPDPITNLPEAEGDVIIETEGVVPKYTYKMHLALAHAGKGARNNKLAWKGFWSWNRLTDDWGEFGLRNDKAFYWSRVKSYGVGE